MKETVTTATKAFILTSKMKAFIAFFSLLLVAWIPAPHNEVGGFTPSHGTAVLVF